MDNTNKSITFTYPIAFSKQVFLGLADSDDKLSRSVVQNVYDLSLTSATRYSSDVNVSGWILLMGE